MKTSEQNQRTHRRSPLDQAVVELVRIVRADGWTPDTAADELRRRFRGNPGVLRLLRARVARAMLERPTTLGMRATLTLERAQPSGEPKAPLGRDRQFRALEESR
ncbi:MAG TPA: hypothetical protein VFD59_12050 [Nocardioidaceae bacterium]|nr:hypothetical protein [Nocardioidaceae bacterium]